MAETLKQKILSDGAKLSLERYDLGNDAAEFLGRPANSKELSLVLDTESGGFTTASCASWHLTEKDFKKLFNTIKSEEDFRVIHRYLNLYKEHIADALGNGAKTYHLNNAFFPVYTSYIQKNSDTLIYLKRRGLIK